mgnify:FL=1
MSKKEVSKKNNALCTLLTIIGIISMVGIAFSKNLPTTALILVISLAVIFTISQNMDKPKDK